MRKKMNEILSLLLLFMITFSCLYLPFINDSDFRENDNPKNIRSAGEISHTQQWLKNNEFLTQDYWFSLKGSQGDNSTVDANISNNQANYEVLGDMQTLTVVSGVINSSTSPGWKYFNKTGFLAPDTVAMTTDGCYASHTWADDPNQFPSAQWRTNVSLGIDMTDYQIVSATLEVIVNATVSSNIDTPNDGAYWENFAIGDSVTFYSQISDLGYNPPKYMVASNKTKYLGQNNPPILTIPDSPLKTVNEIDLIAALNSAFEKDPTHSSFSLTLGIDIYSEDNYGGTDTDTFSDLFIKTCNLTFTVKKKIDQFSSVSWNQIGNTITGGNIQVTDAKLFFMYKIDELWPTGASPFSEMRVVINNNQLPETIRLSSANETFQEAKSGGFDVTYLILKDVNISVSIQIFIANTFALDKNITISIDDVYLNITYIETVPDIQTRLNLFLEGDNKTSDPYIQIQSNELLNITIKYEEKQSGAHIYNATVQLQGKISNYIEEDIDSQQYSILVNTSQLGIGVKTLSVSAQKDNFEVQNLQFFVEVTERSSEMLLYVNNNPTNDSDTIYVEVNQFLNITVYYRDNNTKQHLSGATVSLTEFGGLSEAVNYYNITISTNDLDEGITVLTINALTKDYKPQTIQFYVEVSQRETELHLFVNSNEVTIYEVAIGRMLNITVKYLDNVTGFHISGADIQVNSLTSTFSDNLTEFFSLNHYSKIIDTSSLPIGVNILKITAYKSNYQIKTIYLRLTVRKISGVIITTSGSTFFETQPGGGILLSIILNNTDLGGTIKNAIVTYRWAYGQGNLTDLDDDGVYEAYISEIPIGIYSVIIEANAGNDYAIQSCEITISVTPVSGEDLSWLIYILVGGIMGISIVFILYQTHFKYPPLVRKLRKLRKKVRKGKKLKKIILNERDNIVKDQIRDKLQILDLEEDENLKNMGSVKKDA